MARGYEAFVLAFDPVAHPHLGMTALVFVSMFTFGWLVSFLFTFLDNIHPFPEEIFKLVVRLELYLVYLDAGLSGAILITGIFRFVQEILED